MGHVEVDGSSGARRIFMSDEPGTRALLNLPADGTLEPWMAEY
jgi:hypothetical protein